jgi:hypothetical protein
MLLLACGNEIQISLLKLGVIYIENCNFRSYLGAEENHSVFKIVIIHFPLTLYDPLCGLVVRDLGYRSGGPGSIPRKKSSGSGTGSTQPREYN